MRGEEPTSIEKRLREVSLRPPPPELEKRIASALRSQRRLFRWSRLRRNAVWGGMAAAAALFLGSGVAFWTGSLSLPHKEPPTGGGIVRPDEGFRPVHAENRLQNKVDEGIVFLRNGLPARQYRFEFVDRVVWENPRDGSTMEMEVPREEVVLVPVRTF
jgi:hypothetical protein